MARKVDVNIYSQQDVVRELIQGGPVGDYLKFLAARSKAESIKLAGQRTVTHTGRYSAGFDVQLVPDASSGAKVVLRNTADYGLVMEKGMQPKQADGLPGSKTHNLIVIQNGSAVVFRMVPNTRGKPHPGIEARNVMRDAVESAVRQPYTPGRRT